MFKFVESVKIEASPEDIWEYCTEIEQWWLPANPDHIQMQIHSDDALLGPKVKVSFVENVAGITGHAEGQITKWVPKSEVKWEGVCVYDYKRLRVTIREGITWRIHSSKAGTRLSARVWAKFPDTLVGQFFEWQAKHVLNVVDWYREHTRHELEYLKSEIEAGVLAAKDSA
jgi:hypothetical protein